jgi:hypothetical protein
MVAIAARLVDVVVTQNRSCERVMVWRNAGVTSWRSSSMVKVKWETGDGAEVTGCTLWWRASARR